MSHYQSLEDIVDALGLRETLLMLVSICYNKENHVRSNWQDSGLADKWKECGDTLIDAFMPQGKTPT